MTGYGQAEGECAGIRVTAELRSVNNRNADVRMRLPAELASQEAALRRVVLGRVRRGRVDLTVTMTRPDGEAAEIRFNEPLVNALAALAKRLRDEHGVQGELDLKTLLAVPGVLETREVSVEWGDEQEAAVRETVERALCKLDEERSREGEALRLDLVERLQRMESLVEQVAERALALPARLKQKLIERVEALSDDVSIDPGRLEQEAAFLADRADITEEIVRLRGHLQAALDLLRQPDGQPVGKRMDFLLQEINRESNTVNSKSAQLELSRLALDLRVETEKVREQVQNLE